MSGEPDRELVDRELPDPFPSAGKASGKKRVSSIFTSPALSSSEPDPATARSVMVGHRCSSTLGLPFSLKSSTSRRTHSECDPSVEALSAKRAEVSVSVLHERSLPLQVSTKLLTGRVRVGMAGGGRDRGPPSEGAAAEGPPLPSPPPPPQASGDLVRGGGVEGGSAAGEDAAAGPTEVPSAKPESFPDIAPGGPPQLAGGAPTADGPTPRAQRFLIVRSNAAPESCKGLEGYSRGIDAIEIECESQKWSVQVCV